MLADGRAIDPEDVLGPPEERKKQVIVGDAGTTEGLSEAVRDADVLVIEATFAAPSGFEPIRTPFWGGEESRAIGVAFDGLSRGHLASKKTGLLK